MKFIVKPNPVNKDYEPWCPTFCPCRWPNRMV